MKAQLKREVALRDQLDDANSEVNRLSQLNSKLQDFVAEATEKSQQLDREKSAAQEEAASKICELTKAQQVTSYKTYLIIDQRHVRKTDCAIGKTN